MRKNKGTLYVVSAPSGAGKTTLCRMLLEEVPGIEFSVSCTTRKPRPGEIDGRDYSFISEEDFKAMIDKGEFAEWAEVHGNLYGTSLRRLIEKLDGGIDILLDIDVKGARQIRKKFGNGIYIFVLPPSRKILKNRLSGRKSDTPEVINERIRAATDEIREYLLYDYVIVNDSLETAFEELRSVVVSGRLRTQNIDPSWVEEYFLRQEDV